jgi:hypothetical protein
VYHQEGCVPGAPRIRRLCAARLSTQARLVTRRHRTWTRRSPHQDLANNPKTTVTMFGGARVGCTYMYRETTVCVPSIRRPSVVPLLPVLMVSLAWLEICTWHTAVRVKCALHIPRISYGEGCLHRTRRALGYPEVKRVPWSSLTGETLVGTNVQ